MKVKVSNGANGKTAVADELFKIRADLPVPALHSRYITGKTATLRKLKKGQSVLIPGGAAANSRLSQVAIGKGKYTLRTEGKNCRVWRIG